MQIIGKLREAEVLLSQGSTVGKVSSRLGNRSIIVGGGNMRDAARSTSMAQGPGIGELLILKWEIRPQTYQHGNLHDALRDPGANRKLEKGLSVEPPGAFVTDLLDLRGGQAKNHFNPDYHPFSINSAILMATMGLSAIFSFIPLRIRVHWSDNQSVHNLILRFFIECLLYLFISVSGTSYISKRDTLE